MFFNYKKLLNSNLFGLADSQRYSEPYQVHPLIKRTWASDDVLREALGLTANLVDPAAISGDETVVNERIIESSTFAGPLTSGVNSSGYTVPALSSSPDGHGSTEEVTMTVIFTPAPWNSINISPLTENLLLQEGYGGDLEGDPYFGKYYYNPSLTIPSPSRSVTLSPESVGLVPGDSRMAGAQTGVAPLMRRGQLPTDNGGDAYRILDHRYRLLGYPENNVEIVPTYNYYLDSDPDYEAAIVGIPEGRLPNYYVFEIAVDARRTGGFVADVGVNWAIIGDAMGLSYLDTRDLLDGSLAGSTPQTDQLVSQGYFYTYASSAPDLEAPESNSYIDEYQDIAILSRDLDDDLLETYNLIARDDRGTITDTSDDLLAIDNYPFYNKITIPYMQQYNDPVITDALATTLSPELAAAIMTIAELYTIFEYRNPSSESGAYPEVLFNFYEGSNSDNILTAQNVSIPIVGYLEFLVRAIYNPVASPDYATVSNKINTLIDQYSMGMYANSPGFLDGVQYLRTVASLETDILLSNSILSTEYGNLQNAPEARSLGAIADIAREFEDLFNAGEHAPGQTLMYIVEKRVVPAGQTSIDISDPAAPAPVQTLFFGRDSNERDIVYYDTQIKYGVRYQYDLKRVEMVVGNQYQYIDANTVVGVEDLAGEGRALGNALGFYDDASEWTSPAENDARDWVQTQPEDPPINVTAPVGLPFDYYSPSAPDPNAEPLYKTSEQVGYYIYGLGSSARSATYQDLGQLYSNLPNIWNGDWIVKADVVEIEIQSGVGTNGNDSGGILPSLVDGSI